MCFRKDTTILLLTFIIYATLASPTNKTDEECSTCVRLYDKCHNITHLMDFENNFRETVVITKLGILYRRNILYYAFQPNITDPEYYKIGYIGMNSPEIQGILKGGTPVVNFITFDIDQNNEVFYIASGNGIYKGDFGKKATFYSSLNDIISSITFRKNVFFSRYGEDDIYKKVDDQWELVLKCRNIKYFVMDKNDNIVFLNASGLYVSQIEANETDAVHLSKNVFFRGLTTDIHGDVYAWWIDGIYKVILDADLEKSKIVQIANIPTIGAVTFDDKNNILFSSEKGLYRLDLVQSNTTIC